MQMCGSVDVRMFQRVHANVDAGKDPHFTHTSDMLHSRY